MAEPTDVITIEPNGAVRIGRGLERRLKEASGTYRLVTDVPGLVVLRGEPEPGATPRARVLMAGRSSIA